MDLAFPMSSVVPGAYGAVLTVLARTDKPLSGRQIHELTNGRVGQRRTNDILGLLVADGIATRESAPPAYRYVLNREHVAAPAIESLASLRESLLVRIRQSIAAWELPPTAAWLFGSTAAGSANSASDIDLLLIRTDHSEPAWESQLEDLATSVTAWSGNDCEILDLTTTELCEAVKREDRLVQDLRKHGLALAGDDPASLLRQPHRQALG